MESFTLQNEKKVVDKTERKIIMIICWNSFFY